MVRFLLIISFALPVGAATRYVDSAAIGSRNGTSWADAWTNLCDATGISAGDTVFISGGTTTKTYWLSSAWDIPDGTAGNPVTYQIGQTAGHNGIATIDAYSASTDFVGGNSHLIISGDAGDGQRHIVFGTGKGIVGDNSVSLTFTHIDFGSRAYGISFNVASNISILNCRFYKLPENGAGDDFVFKFLNFPAAITFDQNRFNSNLVYLPRDETSVGYGSDGLQGNPKGLTVADNTFIGYTTNYTGGQHQDGIQWLAGEKCKISGNTFTDIGNYPIFLDGYAASPNNHWTDIQIFNNLVRITDSLVLTGSPQGIIAGEDGGQFAAFGVHFSMTNCFLANNTVVDFGGNLSIGFGPNGGGAIIGSWASNNVSVNSGTQSYQINVTTGKNVTITEANAPATFTSYTELTVTNDFTPKSSDSVLRDQGTDLSGYFGTDKLGHTRSGTWDIGAYEYNGGGGDVTAPTCAISSPASVSSGSSGSYSTSSSTITVSGTASDDTAVTAVTWSNSRGGSGTCTGTTSWSQAGITLFSGGNVITVTVSDGAANATSTVLNVTYTVPAAGGGTNYVTTLNLFGH